MTFFQKDTIHPRIQKNDFKSLDKTEIYNETYTWELYPDPIGISVNLTFFY